MPIVGQDGGRVNGQRRCGRSSHDATRCECDARCRGRRACDADLPISAPDSARTGRSLLHLQKKKCGRGGYALFVTNGRAVDGWSASGRRAKRGATFLFTPVAIPDNAFREKTLSSHEPRGNRESPVRTGGGGASAS